MCVFDIIASQEEEKLHEPISRKSKDFGNHFYSFNY
jgi:hypothetical protein